MPFASRPRYEWKLRTRSLILGGRTPVMGVLNVTPDSFSDGGRFLQRTAAIDGALEMFEQGAAIVDIGGESTRPGVRDPLPAAEEIDRVVPVIEGILRSLPGAILSIDTFKSATAQAALRAGAELVNDVSGFLWDAQLAGVCAAAGCGLVLMHTRGNPGQWRDLPDLAPGAVVPLVGSQLELRLQEAQRAGIGRQHIVLDPGFGFGKRGDNNYALLAGLEQLQALGHPLLVGLSRKSFLGQTLEPLFLGKAPAARERSAASIAAATAAILAGASVVRAHDVRPTVEAAAIADAILASGRES